MPEDPQEAAMMFPHVGKAHVNSRAQSESTFGPFGFPILAHFSKGPKRLTFYFQVFWASE